MKNHKIAKDNYWDLKNGPYPLPTLPPHRLLSQPRPPELMQGAISTHGTFKRPVCFPPIHF